MLRMPIKIDNQPSVIKMVGTTPVLHCPEVELSVQLVVLAQHVSTVLTEYRITLKGAYYDDNYPLYAIDLPPPISYERIQSLLPAFSSICYRSVDQSGQLEFSTVITESGAYKISFWLSAISSAFEQLSAFGPYSGPKWPN